LSSIYKPDGLLFTYKGRPIGKLRRSWQTAVRRSGIRPMLFKHLRHTFNTRLMEAGVIQDIRSELMGHGQGRPRTTNDIYTHVDLAPKRDAIRRLEAWMEAEQAKTNHGPLPHETQWRPTSDTGSS
ncbi:MAG: tyrosine-type recombinase/integrase, partial [Ktedonobacteraceae bacterium]|nr:tyrosine-type recombinase/integrase [Ktedonobacteraceae bacterium]MBA3913233.1 tyrosine-type recombinase/integrase [Terriglobales bacterium]